MDKDKNNRRKIILDREKEMRTDETSRMINEGGLGSRTHYDIEKVSASENETEDKSRKEDKEK